MSPEKRTKILRVYLQVFGAISLLAFVAAAMPAKWMVLIAGFFGIENFPEHPLTWYLARHLSILYGLLGSALLLIARNLTTYLFLVKRLGFGIVALGIMQLFIDLTAPMPPLWTWGESISTVVGGAIIVYLAWHAPDVDSASL